MLVDLNIKNLKSKTHTYFVADEGVCPGLVVRVTPNNNKAFVLRMKINGKRKTKTIGTYGEVSLSEARKRGLELRGQISLGEDIFEAKLAPEPEPQAVPTFRELGEAYVADCTLRNIRKAPDIKRTMNVDVPDSLLDIPAGEVTPHTIVVILKPIINRGSVGQAKKVRTYLHAMFNFGMRSEFDLMSDNNLSFGITSNPVTPVPSPIKGTTVCDRWLDEKEFKKVWDTMPDFMNFNAYMTIRLLLCTGQRVEEILSARWDNITDDILFLPKTKNGLPHEVVLNKTALGLIKQVREVNGHCEVLFPATNATKTPMKSVTISQAIRKMCLKSNVEKWTPRDCRRTVKTLALKHGIKKDVMDLVANHAQHDVSSKHYVRYDYIDEKREAIAQWNEILEDILS